MVAAYGGGKALRAGDALRARGKPLRGAAGGACHRMDASRSRSSLQKHAVKKLRGCAKELDVHVAGARR